MSYKVITIYVFDKQIKRLVKKYPSLKKEYLNLVNSLELEPKQGVALGKNCYKIRINIASKGKGKSGGGRIITNVLISEEKVYLLSIFDKSEQESISISEVEKLLIHVPD